MFRKISPTRILRFSVLYDDPVDGYPPKYPSDSIPQLPGYSDFKKKWTLVNPSNSSHSPDNRTFKSWELQGLCFWRKFLESNGHKFVVTSDKDGDDSVLAKKGTCWCWYRNFTAILAAYITEERFKSAHKLKLWITAGIGSDHVDLGAVAKHKVTIAEVTAIVSEWLGMVMNPLSS